MTFPKLTPRKQERLNDWRDLASAALYAAQSEGEDTNTDIQDLITCLLHRLDAPSREKREKLAEEILRMAMIHFNAEQQGDY